MRKVSWLLMVVVWGIGLMGVGLAYQTGTPPETLWEKTYGGESWDEAWALAPTKDGGFLIAGGTESFGAGGLDIYLFRLGPSPR